MLSVPMITCARRSSAVLVAVAARLALATVACLKSPLLGPAGSTMTVTAGATALPLNGTTQVIAQIIEASGTPPRSGTQVTFLTTLGALQPETVDTDANGRAVTTF